MLVGASVPQAEPPAEKVAVVPLRDRLAERAIVLNKYTDGEYRLLCPQCEGGQVRPKTATPQHQRSRKPKNGHTQAAAVTSCTGVMEPSLGAVDSSTKGLNRFVQRG
eukprot:1249796-Pyramimonas_sp.AAC.1